MARRLNSPDAEGVVHYVTMCVRERKKAFRRDEYACLALQELRSQCTAADGLLLAYIVMPEHLHFLVWIDDGALSHFLECYKPTVTKGLDTLAKLNGREKERQWLKHKGRRELWQDSKYSLPLWNRSWIDQKICYIHDNPVRNGIAQNPQDYLWSSYLAYMPMLGKAPPVPVDLDWEIRIEQYK